MAATAATDGGSVTVRPASPGTWGDVVEILGPRGGVVGCWCTFWRLTNQQAAGRTADDNRATLHKAICSGEPGGLVAYRAGVPAGWCAVAPREHFARVFRTRALAPADPAEPSVWSVTCVFVRPGHRGVRLTDRLVAAAVDYARDRGAAVIEAYPLVETDSGRASGRSSGTVDLFTRAGFTVHARPDVGRRLIMRRAVTTG